MTGPGATELEFPDVMLSQAGILKRRIETGSVQAGTVRQIQNMGHSGWQLAWVHRK